MALVRCNFGWTIILEMATVPYRFTIKTYPLFDTF